MRVTGALRLLSVAGYHNRGFEYFEGMLALSDECSPLKTVYLNKWLPRNGLT